MVPFDRQDESTTNSPFPSSIMESHRFSAKFTKFNRQHPRVRSEKASDRVVMYR